MKIKHFFMNQRNECNHRQHTPALRLDRSDAVFSIILSLPSFPDVQPPSCYYIMHSISMEVLDTIQIQLLTLKHMYLVPLTRHRLLGIRVRGCVFMTLRASSFALY